MSTVSTNLISGMVSGPTGGHLTPSAPSPGSSPLHARHVSNDADVLIILPDAVRSVLPSESSSDVSTDVKSLLSKTSLGLHEKRIPLALLTAIIGAKRQEGAKIKYSEGRVAIDESSLQSVTRWARGDSREDLRTLEEAIPFLKKLYPPASDGKQKRLWEFIRDGLIQFSKTYPAKVIKIEANNPEGEISETEAPRPVALTASNVREGKKEISDMLLDLIKDVETSLNPKEASSLKSTVEAKAREIKDISSKDMVANILKVTVRKLGEVTDAEEAGNIKSITQKIKNMMSGAETAPLSTEIVKIWTPKFIERFVEDLETIHEKAAEKSTSSNASRILVLESDIEDQSRGLVSKMNAEAEKANDVAQEYMHRIWRT